MQQEFTAGGKVNEIGIVMATSPKQQFGVANEDTPYAIATVDLKSSGPMVVELPPGPFIGFVDDHNMRWVQDMGVIGPEKGRGGKHLILDEIEDGLRLRLPLLRLFFRFFLRRGGIARGLLGHDGPISLIFCSELRGHADYAEKDGQTGEQDQGKCKQRRGG